MIFDDDFCRFEFRDGSRADFMCAELQIESWPPPQFLCLAGRNFERVSHSLITDAEKPMLSNIARGALYRHMPEVVISSTQEH